MPNDLGVVAAELLTMEVIERLKYQLPMLTRFAHQFEPVLKHNQKVTINEIGEGQVSDVDVNVGYTSSENRTDIPREVTADKWIQYAQSFNMLELHSSERNLIAEEGNHGAYKIAEAITDRIITEVLPLYTDPNNLKLTIPGAADAFDYDDSREVNRRMKKAKLPAPYNGIINADGAFGLTGDTIVISQDTNPGPQNIVQSQELTRVGAVTWDEYAGFPVLPPTDDKVFGFAGTRDSMLITAGAPDDVAEMVPQGFAGKNYLTGVEIDPDTGFSMRWYIFIDGKAQTADIIYTIRWGAAVGRDGGMMLLESTT